MYDAAHPKPPTVPAEVAARCPVARAFRDWQLAAWHRIPPHERQDFVDRLAAFDERTALYRRIERARETEALRLRALREEANAPDPLMAEIQQIRERWEAQPPRNRPPRWYPPRLWPPRMEVAYG